MGKLLTFEPTYKIEDYPQIEEYFRLIAFDGNYRVPPNKWIIRHFRDNILIFTIPGYSFWDHLTRKNLYTLAQNIICIYTDLRQKKFLQTYDDRHKQNIIYVKRGKISLKHLLLIKNKYLENKKIAKALHRSYIKKESPTQPKE